jgi:hypothetical protein
MRPNLQGAPRAAVCLSISSIETRSTSDRVYGLKLTDIRGRSYRCTLAFDVQCAQILPQLLLGCMIASFKRYRVRLGNQDRVAADQSVREPISFLDQNSDSVRRWIRRSASGKSQSHTPQSIDSTVPERFQFIASHATMRSETAVLNDFLHVRRNCKRNSRILRWT